MEYIVDSGKVDRINGLLTDYRNPLDINVMWLDIFTENSHYTPFKEEHSHSFFEIHFMFKGSLSYICGGEQITVEDGQALFLPPETEHRFVSMSNHYFKVSMGFAIRPKGVSDSLLKSAKVAAFDFAEDVSRIFERILKHAESDHLLVPLMLKGDVGEIVCSVFSTLNIDLPKFPSKPRDHRFVIADKFINDNICLPLTCDEVARQCCISSKQLNRIFKKETDQNLSEYIQKVRAKHCQELLLKGTSIKEIGYQMGFTSESNFTSFFKRHSGVAPGKFRKIYAGTRSEDM